MLKFLNILLLRNIAWSGNVTSRCNGNALELLDRDRYIYIWKMVMFDPSRLTCSFNVIVQLINEELKFIFSFSNFADCLRSTWIYSSASRTALFDPREKTALDGGWNDVRPHHQRLTTLFHSSPQSPARLILYHHSDSYLSFLTLPF